MERLFIFLGYLWSVCTNVVYLGAVLFIFSKLHERFEVIVVSILGLIYVTVRAIGFGHFMTYAQLAKAIDHQFLNIRRLLSDGTVEHDEASMVDATKIVNRQVAKAYIDAAFLSLVWLFCLYQLFTNT
jgi:hypothetical protein